MTVIHYFFCSHCCSHSWSGFRPIAYFRSKIHSGLISDALSALWTHKYIKVDSFKPITHTGHVNPNSSSNRAKPYDVQMKGKATLCLIFLQCSFISSTCSTIFSTHSSLVGTHSLLFRLVTKLQWAPNPRWEAVRFFNSDCWTLCELTWWHQERSPVRWPAGCSPQLLVWTLVVFRPTSSSPPEAVPVSLEDKRDHHQFFDITLKVSICDRFKPKT